MSEPVNVADYFERAAKTVDPQVWCYFEGGSGDEVSLRANAAAYSRWRLRPRMLVDVSTISLETTLLGTPVSMPLGIAPFAMQRLLDPEGELATARAAESGLPIVLKGILTREDALLAVEHGAAAVYVSNHGGRQLDGVAAGLDALPEVAEAVGDRCEVYVDGGIRRGTDVLKALALGARAAFVGRPVACALAVDGERGVSRVLALLRDELELGLGLLGCTSPAEVSRSHVE